jgi:chemotaxis protein MotB
MSDRKNAQAEGEFLWLVSLSDMLILLFVFFVVMVSISYKKIRKSDFESFAASLRHEQPPKSPLDQVESKVKQLVEARALEKEISVARVDDAVLVAIGEHVLFPSAEYRLNGNGRALLAQLSPILEAVPDSYRIGIEGHTDDVPVHSRGIEDNWALAAMRAHSVLRALELSPSALKRTILMSYGEMQPVAPNRSPSGEPLQANRGKNRRVTLRIF